MRLINDLLQTPGLKIRCPGCQEAFSARRARLFDATGPLPDQAALIVEERRRELTEEWTGLERRKKNAREKPQIAGRSVNIGKIVEKIAATLPQFPVKPADCRALFEPIDYVVFPGLSTRRVIESVQFVDVKSGAAQLTSRQKRIKSAVQSGRVSLLLADFDRSK